MLSQMLTQKQIPNEPGMRATNGSNHHIPFRIIPFGQTKRNDALHQNYKQANTLGMYTHTARMPGQLPWGSAWRDHRAPDGTTHPRRETRMRIGNGCCGPAMMDLNRGVILVIPMYIKEKCS